MTELQLPIKTKHRCIATQIPSSDDQAVIETLRQYEPNSMADHCPFVWERAQGYQIFDKEGNSWIDFSSSVVLANIGHANEKICNAIHEQTDRKLLHNYCFPSRIRAKLVQRLVNISPASLEKVFLLTTGSEATECAIKLMRMHGRSLDPKKIGIVGFTNAFHGRTMGSQMAGGIESQQEWIVNLDPDMHHIPFPFCFQCPYGKEEYQNCGEECFARSMQTLHDNGVDPKRIAGFITESFQGATVAFLPRDYVQAMRRWANKYDVLLTFDEIQAGFGRSATLFTYEHYDVEADLVCCGKGISGSLPLSAVLGRARILDLPKHGQMSSSHTGNPVCCAAALANLAVLEEDRLVERSASLETTLRECMTRLQTNHPEYIGGMSCRGLVGSVYCVKPGTREFDVDFATCVTDKALHRGLFMLQTGRGTLKIAPPLTIPEGALREGFDVMEQAICELT